MKRLTLAGTIAAVWISAGWLAAADSKAFTPKTVRRDPVAAAFAVPYGVVLNERQRSEYERLKADREPELRAAINALESATDPGAKSDNALEVRALKREIESSMRGILRMPYNEMLQAYSQHLLDQASSGQYVPYDGYYPNAYSYGAAWVGTPWYGHPWYGHRGYNHSQYGRYHNDRHHQAVRYPNDQSHGRVDRPGRPKTVTQASTSKPPAAKPQARAAKQAPRKPAAASKPKPVSRPAVATRAAPAPQPRPAPKPRAAAPRRS